MKGNIMVDGVLSSCYATYDHDVAHIAMTPMQWFPAIIRWIFGEDTGIQIYVSTTKHLGQWLIPGGHRFGY